MRSSNEIIEQVRQLARNDNRIRAAVQRGSRVNPASMRDELTSFVFVFAVTNLEDFTDSVEFVAGFGKPVIIHSTYDNPLKRKEDFIEINAYMETGELFTCIFREVEGFDAYIRKDSETVLLMDKDACTQPLPLPTDISYRVMKPSKKEFEHTCMDFFMQLIYVTKGLHRDQILYAIAEHDKARRLVMKMAAWYVATKSDNRFNSGKNGKNLHIYLPEEYWEMLMKVFPSIDTNEMWSAAFNSATLFRRLGMEIAQELGFNYPKNEDVGVVKLMREYWGKR